MAKKPEQTASFMIRFNQKIYQDQGEDKVQWRGKVSHVQGGEDLSFSDFKEAVEFIQTRLTQLTVDATKGHPKDQQESIVKKSFTLWKTMAKEGPKIFMETIKDPMKSVDNLKDQLTEFGGEMMEKVPVDQWRSASKSDFQSIQNSISQLAKQVSLLNAKVDAIATAPSPKKKTTTKPRTTAKKSVVTKKNPVKTTTAKASPKKAVSKKTTKK